MQTKTGNSFTLGGNTIIITPTEESWEIVIFQNTTLTNKVNKSVRKTDIDSNNLEQAAVLVAGIINKGNFERIISDKKIKRRRMRFLNKVGEDPKFSFTQDPQGDWVATFKYYDHDYTGVSHDKLTAEGKAFQNFFDYNF